MSATRNSEPAAAARIAPAVHAAAGRPRATSRCCAWLFMRLSGVVLVVLIFGHLSVNLMVGEGIHAIDFGFVAGKWADPFWQVWDLAMLWLAMLHGTNGVRTIINDYAEERRHPPLAEDRAVRGRRRHHHPRHPGDLHL